MENLLIITLILGLCIATFWDLKTRKIPNLITYPLMLLGLSFHIATCGLAGLKFSTAGLFTGMSVFLIPYLMGGMGAGDAKLMAGTGAIIGFTDVIIAAVLSVLSGLAYAIILLLIHRNFAKSFLKRTWTTMKTYFFTKQWIPIPPAQDEKQPVLSYALPITMGTLCILYIKATDSNLIHDFIEFHFFI
jgi:prepilin peptidase CpaA